MMIQNLGGDWNIQSADGQLKLQTRVPGTVMDQLEKENYFGKEGIFWKKNNRKVQPYAHQDYIFSRTFYVDRVLLKQEKILLECDGLDTLATVYINGREAGRADNMHRRYRFSLNELLKEGENSIEIRFDDSIEYILKKRDKRPLLHSYHDLPDTAQAGFNQIRKSHCSYGWDWGPIVPDVGIWRDIRLSAYSGARLDHVQIRQRHHNKTVTLEFMPRLEKDSGETPAWTAFLEGPEGESFRVTGPADETLSLEIENPKLWWPRGLGEQPIYRAEFSLEGQDQLICKELGLRTLEVNRQEDQWGQAFNFRCNGQDFFAMGADYIPEDLFLTRVSPERTRLLLEEAARANFNCIRVWGGGVYPDEAFYAACDALGLVVWQDFMFACALYDVDDPEFRENIRLEAVDNVERLHHHASLGLFCGNNEMEWALETWEDFMAQAKEDKRIRQEYLLQYENLLQTESRKAAPDVFYWPASPSSGGGFDEPNAPERGDCHFWDVWHGYHPYEEFQQHYFRFMSEFGFESFPHWKTVQSFSTEEDHSLFSEVMEDHQRGGEGNKKLKYYLDKYFREPKDFRSLVYLSQVSQAEAIRHGVQHWRRHRGRCMGAVYWQFNDNWPVNSWSSIDYYGRWKALHYQARRDYESLILTCCKEDQAMDLHLSHESWGTEQGQIRWQLLNLGGELIIQGKEEASVGPFESRRVCRLELESFLKEHSLENLVLSAHFVQEGVVVRSLLEHFTAFKELELQDPALKWSLKEEEKGFRLEIQAFRPAFFVEIDLGEGEGRLSDNFFHMDGREGKVVEISRSSLSMKELEKNLRLISLFDSYAL